VRTSRSPTRSVRREYTIEPGYLTPDRAIPADNGFFSKGKPREERGPAFKVPNRSSARRLAVLLGEWKNRPHTVSAKRIASAIFSKGGQGHETATGQAAYGSVSDFYREMSYGELEISGKVFEWIELEGSWTRYRDASFGSPIVSDSLIEGVLARDGPSALDGFDAIAFVWAGNPVRRTSALWPMRVTLKNRPGVVAFKMGELHLGEMSPIGVACHELGHTFGVDDKYGLGATRDPLGPWCLMGRGTHGAAPSGRHRPFHLCAWCKSVIGWVKPVAIDPSRRQRLALRPILHGPGECYRILLRPDGSEYLLLENRRREGFFTDLPSAGLVVLHVGPNDAPASPQTRVRLLPAHGLPSPRRGDVARHAEVAWPGIKRKELVVGNVRLSHIRLLDDVVYFEVGEVRGR
jgi:M6 family metalloprotease-like protein